MRGRNLALRLNLKILRPKQLLWLTSLPPLNHLLLQHLSDQFKEKLASEVVPTASLK
jgi:hypothetical protein